AVTETVAPGQERFEGVVLRDGPDVPVLVFEAAGERLPIGTQLAVEGAIQPAEPGDDRAFLLYPAQPPVVLAGAPPMLAWSDDLRSTFLATTQRLPGDGGDLLAGLAIGDTSAVTEPLDAAMTASSLTHLTAVSGANCAIVVGLVLALARAAGLPRAARAVTALGALIAFVVLVTPEPSVLRAALMAGLVLFAMLGGRPARGVPILALAVLGLLAHDPWLARSYGFALSVLATAGLLLLAAPLAAALQRRLPSWLALVLAVPVAAQLACQPVVILLDPSLPTYGVVANLLAAPAAPVATVVGLAACVAASLLPPVGSLLAAVAWLPAAWIAAVAAFFAELPVARLPWPGGIAGATLLAAVTVLVIVALLRRSRWAALVVVTAVVIYAGMVGGARVAQLVSRPGDWQLAGCDVGQGDAFLVRSAGRIALIDTGPEPAPLRACLDELDIDRIDLLVLSHYDLDHVGGTEAVLGRVDVALVGPTGGPDDEALLAQLRASGAEVREVVHDDSGILGAQRWRVLWPPARLSGFEPGNDASVVLALAPLDAGGLSALFLGDLGEQAQQGLRDIPEVDVVKVSHHGSADQSAEVYQRASATVGAIGVGQGNGYGHPTDRLLDLLASVGTVPVRTDEDGLVLLAPGDGDAVRVWTQR
ncbi:MAG TPA: ComEC/Rec2 family competence protein, partial [Rhodoglobus sp.]|nr:ComEC/Rec2 family competence protein [Rhodoglobus sp.]